MLNKEKEAVIHQTLSFVKDTLARAEGGHDWWHIYRVWQLAKKIAENEEADIFLVQLGALLHDIADAKFHNGDETVGPRLASKFLISCQVDPEIIEHVENIVRHISFKGGNHEQTFHSRALDIIQDADRLDALGAIGIARTFNYGGFANNTIYDPDIEPKLNMSKEEYKKSKSPTLNHFYEKLLLLKDRMNTPTGKKMAEARHNFMLKFLDQFYREWDREI